MIVSRIRMYREGLGHALANEGVEVVGAVGLQEVASWDDRAANVCLLDVLSTDGLPALRWVSSVLPELPIVLLGVTEHESDIVSYAEAGIAGYVTADASISDLVLTIRSVADGGTPCSPRIARALMGRVAALATERPGSTPAVALTARELEIGRLLGHGLSNKEIARELCIELTTVKCHVHNVLAKLGVRRRSEVASKLRSAGAAI